MSQISRNLKTEPLEQNSYLPRETSWNPGVPEREKAVVYILGSGAECDSAGQIESIEYYVHTAIQYRVSKYFRL